MMTIEKHIKMHFLITEYHIGRDYEFLKIFLVTLMASLACLGSDNDITIETLLKL